MITKISKRGMEHLEDQLHNAIEGFASIHADMERISDKRYDARNKVSNLLRDYKQAVQIPLKKENESLKQEIKQLSNTLQLQEKEIAGHVELAKASLKKQGVTVRRTKLRNRKRS